MGVIKEPGRKIPGIFVDHILTSCIIKTVYEIAKQIRVRAMRAVICGNTTMTLWPRGSGF
jgi:hypothetical protein